jgi:hypothetical protein
MIDHVHICFQFFVELTNINFDFIRKKTSGAREPMTFSKVAAIHMMIWVKVVVNPTSLHKQALTFYINLLVIMLYAHLS